MAPILYYYERINLYAFRVERESKKLKEKTPQELVKEIEELKKQLEQASQ